MMTTSNLIFPNIVDFYVKCTMEMNEIIIVKGKLFFEKVLKLYIENGPFEAIDSRKQNFMNNVPSCKD